MNILSKKFSFARSEKTIGRFLRGAFWAILGNAFYQGLTLLTYIIIARLLGSEIFGELSILNNTVLIFGEFSGLGLGLTATKYIAEYRNDNKAKVSNIISLVLLLAFSLSTFCSLVVFTFAGDISRDILNAPHLENMLRAGSFLIIINTLIGAVNGIFSGFELYKNLSIFNIGRGILNLIFITLSVYYYGIFGAIIANVIISGAILTLALVVLSTVMKRQSFFLSFRKSFDQLNILYHYSLPAFLSNIFPVVAMWVANVILINRPNGYSEMGQLNAALQFRGILMFLPTIVIQVLLPFMVNSVKNTDNQENTLLIYSQSITKLLVIPVGCILIFVSDYIPIIYGESFYSSGSLFIGITWSVMIVSLGMSIGTYIQASGKMWIALIVNLSYSIILIIFAWTTAGLLGANSIAFGSAVAYALTTLWTFHYLSKELPNKMSKRIYLALLLSLCVVALALVLQPILKLFTLIPVCIASCYIILNYLIDKKVKELILENFKINRI